MRRDRTQNVRGSSSEIEIPRHRILGYLSSRIYRGNDRTVNAKLELNLAGALGVLYSAIGSLLLAYAGWSYVVRRLGAARAGVTLHLMPGMGVVLAAALLREYPRWFHFAGIALILAGVALSSLRASSASSNR